MLHVSGSDVIAWCMSHRSRSLSNWLQRLQKQATVSVVDISSVAIPLAILLTVVFIAGIDSSFLMFFSPLFELRY